MPRATSLLARLRHQAFSSPGHQRLADVILTHLDDVPTWGIHGLALEAGTSPAAVVRFAKALGCTGFSDLRNTIYAETRVRDLGEERLLRAPQEASALMVDVARRDLANIEHAVQLLDETRMSTLAVLLKEASHRVLVGHGISWIMAQHLAYILTHCGLVTVAGSPAEFGRQVVNLTPRDVLVAFSFPPYSKETRDVVRHAQDEGVPVVAFSDGPRSPLFDLATVAITVPGENLFFSHSLAAFSVIAQALGTALTQQDPEGALQRLHDAEQINRGQLV